ncbi:hypothetical protein JOC54_003020 [Alkalihalobacillus xiaoxiensis]|uniref:Streptomycin adenylyltransferase n=1 Tax=Shouchella xiaoxiensis TaxID=766895 RepID=A0ABS2SW30_9BACI|nr:hypothetical protein [Shouchella xiaoxiensis]
MRTERQMMACVDEFIKSEDLIRVAVVEGSRTNKQIERDWFQDYDLSFFVTDMEVYKGDESWLDHFGKRR